MNFVKDALLWIYWNPFKYFIQKIPVKYTYFIARILGNFFYCVAHNKKHNLERELNFILGNKLDDKEKKKTVREALKVFMCNELEVLLYPVLNEKNISSFVICSGFENLNNALSYGKGAMLLFAHFGANQMVMPAIGYSGYKISQLSAPATVWKEIIPNRKFSRMEERSMQKRWNHELSLPATHINIFGSLKKAFLCLKRNEVLGVAIDGGGGKDRVSLKFLSKEALLSLGAIDIARRTRCNVLPTFMVRDECGHNKMIIEQPFQVDQGGDVNKAVMKSMERFVQRLEEYVLKYPDHYLNFLALRRFMAEQGDTQLFI